MQRKNRKSEHTNERITAMSPAVGWWKRCIDDAGNEWTEAVAFFATVEYETRLVWEGGATGWEKEQVVFANSGNGEEWFIDFISAAYAHVNERLFYDPDFRLSAEDQQAGETWIRESHEYNSRRAAAKVQTG